MKIKDDIVQLQAINGTSYSIPLDDIHSLTVYSDSHWQTKNVDSKTIFSLDYTNWERRDTNGVPYIEELPISRKDFDQLKKGYIDLIEDDRDFPDGTILNAFKI